MDRRLRGYYILCPVLMTIPSFHPAGSPPIEFPRGLGIDPTQFETPESSCVSSDSSDSKLASSQKISYEFHLQTFIDSGITYRSPRILNSGHSLHLIKEFRMFLYAGGIGFVLTQHVGVTIHPDLGSTYWYSSVRTVGSSDCIQRPRNVFNGHEFRDIRTAANGLDV